MPTVSMFYGIIVRMYFAPREHPRQVKLVQAWAELHQEELLADWQLVMNGEKPFSIQPLQ